MRVSDNTRGLILAVISSAFIGSSFILKKLGLKRAAAYGARAGLGGYAYLLEPLWWIGMTTMLFGETANFIAYVFAPAVLVTPLGALSIIISAVLSHFLLEERLQKMGILGCISCIVGSVVIVIHAPQEHSPTSVEEIWILATQPGTPCELLRVSFFPPLSNTCVKYIIPALFAEFMLYSAATVAIVLALILHFEPRYGQTNILVYLSICSLMGSLTIVSIKAIGVAIKLTLEGISQIAYPQTWFFVAVAVICVVTQLNYLNKALDTFNTAMVSPIYYVMFTTMTIVASGIMFKDWYGQSLSTIVSELCGFMTVLSGTILLQLTREQKLNASADSISWHACKGSIESLKDAEDNDHFVALLTSEYVK